MALSKGQIAKIRMEQLRKILGGKRPPRGWWYRCVGHVKEKGGGYDPNKVCGSLWYRKMSPAARMKVKRIEAEELAQKAIKAASRRKAA